MAPPTAPSPLPTLLSQALVAWTIEVDNEAHRLAHQTTRGGEGRVEGKGPWLVSYPLWANVLQYVEPEGTTVADLTTRARTSRLLLGGLRRWGYLQFEPPAGEPPRSRRSRPRSCGRPVMPVRRARSGPLCPA